MELLATRGFAVTQATVSRDIAELGLVKVARADGHVYASPEDLARAAATDVPLRRLLGDLPVTIRRSGLTLLLITTRAWPSALSQAIDESTLPGPGRHARRREHRAGAVRRRGATGSAGGRPSSAPSRSAGARHGPNH